MADGPGMTGDDRCNDDALSIYSMHKIVRQTLHLEVTQHARQTHAQRTLPSLNTFL